jgi:hypothetical protein
MGTAGSDTGAKAKGAKRPVLQDLQGLCADTLKHIRVASIELWKSHLDLSLKDLVESTYSDIFPPRVFLAQCSVPQLGLILEADVLGNLPLAGKKTQTLYVAITWAS